MLTDAQCRNAVCSPDKKRARFTDAGGLYLEVSPAGSKRWFWKTYFDGKEGRMAFGSYPDVSLTAARKARDAAKLQKSEGIPPPTQAPIKTPTHAPPIAQTAQTARPWHRRGTFGTLRMHPGDAGKIGCKEGDWVSMTTRRGNARAAVELGDDLQPGHVSLPNGHGLDYTAADGTPVHKGVSLNELTDTTSRDPFAGTPWHKYVPVRIERLSAMQEAAA
ncbi:MAG: integrase arm-type DNA-binding domain-containing protein [Comamonadaceae bacterium]|jgi:anaerobic selenocysteine-containing dehydrogenase|uniref:integrase arm-type DNA-binding domain-containing protein n=1 Tax=Candidatus Skiveiella danica TaxID=3386177 RepID=UPI001B525EEB|nr:integrase arm-type DNA-binding domain-containing protein [Comamonadaceae bacterium]MBK9200235.1 integrase arm-type DNA-binding domain-containing protein [Betaproteobacteria bacterium]MBP6502467.1 integrase arm-type DNA-binding domain-containing protein [Rhodoferax sp.]MBK6556978.1 integrase arm-type DNA-binding domain-containing protein [Comamonadaceae bacterium]MBK6926520.1 integrase arm-type DNA-binding domain-containing protein [Comamonadaceae bacterium]